MFATHVKKELILLVPDMAIASIVAQGIFQEEEQPLAPNALLAHLVAIKALQHVLTVLMVKFQMHQGLVVTHVAPEQFLLLIKEVVLPALLGNMHQITEWVHVYLVQLVNTIQDTEILLAHYAQ